MEPQAWSSHRRNVTCFSLKWYFQATLLTRMESAQTHRRSKQWKIGLDLNQWRKSEVSWACVPIIGNLSRTLLPLQNLYMNLLRKTKHFLVGGLSKHFWESKTSLNFCTYISVLRCWRRSNIRHRCKWCGVRSSLESSAGRIWKSYSILQQDTVSARTTILCNTAWTTGTCGCSETVSHLYLWP